MTHLRAILLFAAAVSLWGIMDGLGKFLTDDFPLMQLVWARYAFAVPVILLAAAPSQWPSLMRCERPLLQGARALLPIGASAAVLMGLGLMPLANSTALTFASPLFVVALSVPVLRERVSAATWIGVALGFVGVLIIARPGSSSLAWAALLPLTTAFLFGLYQLLTRLVSRDNSPGTALAWAILPGALLLTLFLPLGWANGTPAGWLLLVLSGLLYGGGHYLMIRAFAAAPAAILTPFSYTQMIAAVLFGLIVLGEIPDPRTLAGTALIVLAGIYVARRA